MLRRLPLTPLTLAAIGLAVAWTVVLSRWHLEGLSSPLDRFEEVCLDLRFLASPGRGPPADVVIVAIDDETVRTGGGYPLPRLVLASIIQAVAKQKPRAVALDLLLLDRTTPEADHALSEALGVAPTVIAAAGLFHDEQGRDTRATIGSASAVPNPNSILWPIDAMTGSAEVGLVNIATGFAGTPRHVPLLFRQDSSVIPSFVLLAAALATGQSPKLGDAGVALGEHTVALDTGLHLVLRHYGPRGTIPSVSGARMLEADPPDISGRVVLIGATATGGGDTFPTPFTTVVPGVEILATAVDNLLAGDALVRTGVTRWIDTVAAAGLAGAAIAMLAMRRVSVGLVLVLLMALAWGFVTLLAFNAGYWLSTSLPVAAMVPVAAFYLCGRLVQERTATARLAVTSRGLRPFQPKPLSDLLARDPRFLDEPRLQNAAVLFVDLSGYTTLSEGTDSVLMRNLLKSFHSLIDEVVHAHGGFVATFMGDGAMILFGFPEQRDDDAARSLSALHALQSRLHRWGTAQRMGLREPLHARLTAHYGPVVISRLGGETHEQITATGDTVNVASRLHDVAKQHGVSAVVTEHIIQAANLGALDRFTERLEVGIRGRRDTVWVRLSRGW